MELWEGIAVRDMVKGMRVMLDRLKGKGHTPNWLRCAWFVFCAAVMPVCFLLSIFKPVTFNSVVIMLSFVFFCVWLFAGKDHSDFLNISFVDRFIIAVVAASFLTTLRASDMMADFQGVAYTHIEELQRLIAAAVIAVYIYHYSKKAFYIGLLSISWIIWMTAVYQLYVYVPQLVNAGVNSIASLEANLHTLHYQYLVCSVYGHPIPCATAFVIGAALPLVWNHPWADLLLKLIYLPALYISYSRSGWIGFAAVLVLFAFGLFRKRHKVTGKWWIVIIAVPVLCVFLLYLWVFHLDGRAEMIGGTNNGRLRYWHYLLTVMIPERPLISKLFGNGFYTAIVMDQTPVAMPGFPAVDNGFLTLLYEEGIFGMIALVCLLWRAVCSVWNNDNKRCYAIALIGAAITGVFYEIQYWTTISFLLIILFAVFFGRKEEKPADADGCARAAGE